MLFQAGLDAGLGEYETNRTIQSAMADMEFDYREEVEVYERVQVWLDAHSGMKPLMIECAQHLAYEAITCNTTRPQLSQTKVGADLGKDRAFIGRTLKLMETKVGAVKVHTPPGRQANGRSHCNNYQLTIAGVSI
ncbi:hypothetical protein A7K94_0201770 [Modestobacter sp. VKM Ac-2676]|nr:hypothetical protein A7K94_0201770 [Modestobacter sp. VKM Ac-2676]